MNPQDIINAIICYFFLGPILLLARNNPNFSHPFVQGHAKRSSMIFLVALLTWIVYIYLIKPITHFTIGPFFLSDTILLLGVVLFLSILLYHAYLAYKGKDITDIHLDWVRISQEQVEQKVTLSDREKILSILSFVPYLGIYISARYPNSMTKMGEALGTVTGLFIITTSILFRTGYSVGLIITLLYIIFVVTLAVRLFIEDVWTENVWIQKIPGILDLGLSIKCGCILLGRIILVAFGQDSSLSWRRLLEEKRGETIQSIENPYMFYPAIIAIPGVNLITLPSLFMERYREWGFAILQGFIITITSTYIIYMYSSASLYLGLLLFPIVVLTSYLPTNPRIESPVIGLVAHLVNILTFHTISGKEKIKEMKENTEKVEFRYEGK